MKMLLSAAIPSSSTDPHPSGRSLLSHDSSSTMQGTPARRFTDAVECPKCGKRSIVARSPNTFDCLNCNFHRELSPMRPSVSQPSSKQHRAPHPKDSLVSSRLAASHPLRSGLPERGLERRMERGARRNLTQRSNLNALFASEAYRTSLEIGDEMEEETSQPWLFAAIAVIFGILLL